MNPKDVGSLIRQKRLELKLTQKELAARIGVTDKAVSQWERGICFPDICMVEPVTRELNISLSEIFTDSAQQENQKESMDKAIKNTLDFAEDGFKKRIHRYKMAGLLFFAFPLFIFLIMLTAALLLIFALPDAAITETIGFLFFASWLYLMRLGLPFFLGYLILLWRNSHFMNSGMKGMLKKSISVVGLLLIVIWLYESLKIIVPNLVL